jgi:hypothetical protein
LWTADRDAMDESNLQRQWRRELERLGAIILAIDALLEWLI